MAHLSVVLSHYHQRLDPNTLDRRAHQVRSKGAAARGDAFTGASYAVRLAAPALWLFGRGPDDYQRARAAQLEVFDLNVGVLNHLIGKRERASKVAGQKAGRARGLAFDGPAAGALRVALVTGPQGSRGVPKRVPTPYCDLFERRLGLEAAHPWHMAGSALSAMTGTLSLIFIGSAAVVGAVFGVVLGKWIHALRPMTSYLAEIKTKLEHRLVKKWVKEYHDIHRALPHGEAQKRLDNLIGLQTTKSSIADLIGDPDMHPDHRKIGQRPSRHLNALFCGRTGTGKQTVAKLYGSLLRDAGILEKGHTVTVTHGTFFDRTLAGTRDKTQQLIELAMGGVLFVPWAHYLGADPEDETVRVVLAELTKAMKQYRGRIAIVFSTYPDQLNKFSNLNPEFMKELSNTTRFF